MFSKLVAVLNAVAAEHQLAVVVSTHPRTQKRVDALGARFHEQVRLLKPLGFRDYVKLQMESRATLSDSGTINEESSILKWFGMLENVSGAPGLDLPALDVSAVASAYGVPSQRVSGREELTEALRTAIGSGGPELVEVQVAPGMALS